MAKSKSFFGLRTGSTKSHTYQILNGEQITKDRVYKVRNPQTSMQMIQRVVFATVTQAADKMLPIIGISQQGVTNETEARRRWVSQNVKKLREAALRMNKGGAVEAAFAPKGNQQLIPNSYLISKGSLTLASALVPKTTSEGGASFRANRFDQVGAAATLQVGQTYTALQLWKLLLGVDPGDQLTFPQIYGEGEAQTLIGANGSTLDLTRYTDFVAPRIVFRNGSEADEEGVALVESITVTAETTMQEIKDCMKTGINPDDTWWDPEDIAGAVSFTTGGEIPYQLSIGLDYDEVFAINNDDPLRAIGCIRSHKNISTGKWEYSTSSLVCIWAAGVSSLDYFGFTLYNAAETYKNNVTVDAEGNFLQRGTDSNIVPESFM